MAVKTNIKIVTYSGKRLDYTTPESLNIKLNRVADDYRKPDTRFGEFSYTFSLPKTKNNGQIFENADTSIKQNKFRVNPINIRVFNNDAPLVDGTLELRTIQPDSYECVFFSKLTQLVDAIEDLNLEDVTVMPHIADWDEETSQRTHIDADYADSDATDYQFPLVFYNTWFTPWAAYEGLSEVFCRAFRAEGDRPQQNYYYLLNRTQNGDYCERYMHEFPLCFYLKTVLEGVLRQVGWSLSGSFWEQADIKKILLLYTGENDIYDAARYSSGGTIYLNTNKFMPKYKATKFLKDIINTFNLYLRVDTANKILAMETYDTMFGSKIAPYDITQKVLSDTIAISRIDDYDFSINFDEAENRRIMSDNYFIGGTSTNALTVSYLKTSDSLFESVINHVGETDGEVSVGFQAPNVKRMYIRNTDNYSGSVTNANDSVIFLPNMSEQTPQDNDKNKFNKATGDTKVYNEEDSIKFKGKPCLMYYYGISDNEFNQQSGKGDSSDYYYYDFDGTKQKIGIASPFCLKDYRANVDTQLAIGDSGSTANMYASYLQSIYLNMGADSNKTTDFSLIFGDSQGLYNTLYSKFYGNRTKRYRESEMMTASIRMNDVDWTVLQLNQPVLYNKEIYSLMAIKNYDVVKGTASIELIKQL